MRTGNAHRAFTLIETVVVMAIIGVLLALSLAAVHQVRHAAYRTQCSNRLRQIGLALHQYHEENRTLPPGCSYQNGRDPYPHMSWCTRLLPFLGQSSLWDEAKAAFEKEPFFLVRPPHMRARSQPLYLCPADDRETYNTLAGFTYFLGVEGTDQLKKDGLLFLDSKVRFSEVLDGQGTTLLVGERPPSTDGHFGWWYAGWGQNKDGSAEMILGVREIPVFESFRRCPADANRFRQGIRTNQCDALHYWSAHPSGAHFLMCDGSVHFLSYSADKILPALATRAGNEAVEWP